MAKKRASFTLTVCILLLGFGAFVFAEGALAATPKKKKKKKQKSSISIAHGSHFTPTMTGAPGTVKYYFFPTVVGTQWTLRTIQLLFDQKGKLLRADTLYTDTKVVDSSRFSLQRLPLMLTSDTSYKSSGLGVRSESVYYVDDSVAMTVVNNSITSQDNRIFLVAPVLLRNAWHEKYEDTTVTAVAGFVDSVMTPLGRFDSVLVTLTQKDYSDMRKFYAHGYGIVKTIFRSPGPGGRGLVVVTSEMIVFTKPKTEEKH